jgi:hypothetical protein
VDWAHPATRPSEDQGPFQFQMAFAAPARKASKIATLKGQVQLIAGGEIKSVKVTHLPGNLGAAVKDEILKVAGLSVTPTKPTGFTAGIWVSQGQTRMIALVVSGNLESVRKLSIVDTDGKKVGEQSMSSTEGGITTYYLDGAKALDDTMTLQIDLNVGQKTITVPFEFHDIALP